MASPEVGVHFMRFNGVNDARRAAAKPFSAQVKGRCNKLTSTRSRLVNCPDAKPSTRVSIEASTTDGYAFCPYGPTSEPMLVTIQDPPGGPLA